MPRGRCIALDRVDDLVGLAVEHGDRVALLVRDEDLLRQRRARRERASRRAGHPVASLRSLPVRVQVDSERSIPSVSSWLTWCRNSACGDTEATTVPAVSSTGWRSWPSQSRNVSFCPLKAARSNSSRADEVADRGEVAAAGARRRLAEHPERHPDLIVLVPGRALRLLLEAGLPLRRAPGLVRRVPGLGHQPGRAGDRRADPRCGRAGARRRPRIGRRRPPRRARARAG